jgi:hypothetical protein
MTLAMDESFHKINVPDMKNIFKTSDRDVIDSSDGVNFSRSKVSEMVSIS